MSDIDTKGEFTTKLRDDTFLHFAERSTMGVVLIQDGCLLYFNKRFKEIFDYTTEEISKWEKLEYFKIIHPEDVPKLLQKIKIEDDKNATLQFRGVKKDGDVINIENYVCRIKFNNKYAFLSSYIILEKAPNEYHIPELIKTKEEKLILLKFSPNIVKHLENNNLNFEIIKRSSYREED